MIKSQLISIFFLIGISSFAQSISGKILDKDGMSISYVEIVVIKNKALKTTISNEQGDYKMKLPENGYYLLEVVKNGSKVYSKNILIEGNVNQNINLSESDEIEIKEVLVLSKKKLIERKVDRLVFNVQNSIASQGMSVLDALKNTPLLKIQEDNISIIGKSNMNVMINDRIINLSGVELINYLQSLRSDDISKIEVITTPPSRYEAQGNSGIVNIILKKNSNLGWSGSLSTNYVRRSEDGFSNNVNLNYQNRKITSSLKLRHYDNKKRSSEENTIEAINFLNSKDKRLDMNNGLGFNFNTEMLLTDKSKLGFVYDFAKVNQNMNINNVSDYKTSTIRDSILSTEAIHRQNAQNHTVNLYYDYKIDSIGKKLSLNANYFSNNPENEINFITKNLTYNNTEIYRSNNYTKYNVWSLQGDLILPFKFLTFETGMKFSNFDNKSNLKYYRIDGEPVLMPDGMNLFNYNEDNYALYLSVEKSLSEQWTAKGGVRYEYSIIKGESPIKKTYDNYNYGQFFPTAYLTYKHNVNNVFNLSYSRRINRPSFRALNPNRWYTNPYTYSKGNPLLKPSYNNNFELGYSFKNKLNISLFYQIVTNSFSQLVTYVNGKKTIDYFNMYNEKNFGFDLSYYNTFLKIWDVNLSTNVYYAKNKNIIPQIIGQNSLNVYYNINNTVSLSSSKNAQLYMNYSQMLPGAFGEYKSDGYSTLNIGGKFSFMEKKMQINIFFEDIFRTGISKGKSIYSDFIIRNINYYDLRSFNISLNYSFGNSKVKGANRNINFDERSRAK